MKLPGVKNLDQIGTEADSYEAIITPYPSLADSLSERTSAEVRTPRGIAYEGDNNYRRKMFLDLASRNVNWKRAAHLVSAGISCWRNTGSLEKLEGMDFSSEEIEKLKETFREVENPVYSLSELSIKGDIAVLHPENLDQLERDSLPDIFETIEHGTDEEFKMPVLNSFSSAGTLVRSLQENIEKLEPEKVGIAVSPDSRYRSLIESVLEAEGIPFQKSQKTSESDELRTYINLLRAALSGNRARLNDLKPIMNNLDLTTGYSDGNKYLSSLDGDIQEFKEFFNVLPHLTFKESLENLEKFGYDPEVPEKILELASLEDADINSANLEKLEYVAGNYAPEERNESGVLLADPRETPRIDRETVFFIGMDSEWNIEPDEWPWIDENRIKRVHRERIRSLLQSGERQVYMIQKKELEKKVRPCHQLTELLEGQPSNFDSVDHRDVRPESFRQGEGFQKNEVDAEISEATYLSQSALNTFAQSPRLYYFDRLLPSEDKAVMAKGRLFHDFAEFYVNYPDFLDEVDITEIQSFFMDKMRPYIEDIDEQTLRTEIRLGIGSITSFIDEKDIDRRAFSDFDRGGSNEFIDEFGKELRFNQTELSFRSDELKAKGKIDLAVSETELADFKSGRKKSAKKKVESSRVQTYKNARFPDFQAPMYLSFLRKRNPDSELTFTFFHFLHDLGEQLRNGSDLEEMKLELHYYPETFDEYKSREDVFEQMTSGVASSNDRRKTLEKMGYDVFRDFMESNEFPDVWERESLMKSDFVQNLQEKARKEVGDYKYVSKGVESATGKLLKKRQTNYFREDLDLFEKFLKDKIEELNECREEGFPVNAKIDDLPEKDLLIK